MTSTLSNTKSYLASISIIKSICFLLRDKSHSNFRYHVFWTSVILICWSISSILILVWIIRHWEIIRVKWVIGMKVYILPLSNAVMFPGSLHILQIFPSYQEDQPWNSMMELQFQEDPSSVLQKCRILMGPLHHMVCSVELGIDVVLCYGWLLVE